MIFDVLKDIGHEGQRYEIRGRWRCDESKMKDQALAWSDNEQDALRKARALKDWDSVVARSLRVLDTHAKRDIPVPDHQGALF